MAVVVALYDLDVACATLRVPRHSDLEIDLHRAARAKVERKACHPPRVQLECGTARILDEIRLQVLAERLHVPGPLRFHPEHDLRVATEPQSHGFLGGAPAGPDVHQRGLDEVDPGTLTAAPGRGEPLDGGPCETLENVPITVHEPHAEFREFLRADHLDPVLASTSRAQRAELDRDGLGIT